LPHVGRFDDQWRVRSWASYYLIWIGLPMLVAIVSAHPWVLGLAVIAVFARRWLPDPFLLAKHAGRVRALEAQVRTNPANATACRDLGMIWLERRRPRRALRFIEQAQAREPDNTELQYLAALARLGAGEHEAAATALLAIAQREPRFRQGDPYLRAADGFLALRRWDDAIAALRTFVTRNQSSVEARVKLARGLHGAGRDPDADAARRDARHTYRDLPRFQRRAQWLWYLRAWLPV
jgi:tetratricopeptide (TPR) repeat protein